jgi:hypothetical protein
VGKDRAGGSGAPHWPVAEMKAGLPPARPGRCSPQSPRLISLCTCCGHSLGPVRTHSLGSPLIRGCRSIQSRPGACPRRHLRLLSRLSLPPLHRTHHESPSSSPPGGANTAPLKGTRNQAMLAGRRCHCTSSDTQNQVKDTN